MDLRLGLIRAAMLTPFNSGGFTLTSVESKYSPVEKRRVARILRRMGYLEAVGRGRGRKWRAGSKIRILRQDTIKAFYGGEDMLDFAAHLIAAKGTPQYFNAFLKMVQSRCMSGSLLWYELNDIRGPGDKWAGVSTTRNASKALSRVPTERYLHPRIKRRDPRNLNGPHDSPQERATGGS